EEHAYSPYELEVFAYVGLAYYDDDNDGFYNDPSPGSGFASYDFTTGNYPTLYDNNAPNGFPQEIGALVQMQPFIINPMTGFLMEDTDAHLPIDDGSQNPKPYATNDGFRFPGGLTQQEEDLLKQYGKVFFYEVNIFENGNLIDHAVLYPEVETLAAGHPDWKPAETTPGSTVQMQGIAPSLGTAFDLFYYRNISLPNGTEWDVMNP